MEKYMVYGLLAIGENWEAPEIIVTKNVDIVIDESGNREVLNDLVNDRVDTEKVPIADV